MKKNLLLLFPLWLAASVFFGEDIAVPDLETRITNSGRTIPEAALPALKPPKPSVLPVPAAGETAVPALPAAVPAVLSAALPAETSGAADTATFIEHRVSGYFDFGLGSPSALFGDVYLTRQAGTIPGFSVNFRSESADGYGLEKSAEGFFDRKTVLGVSLFNDAEKTEWEGMVRLSDRLDGLQAMDSDSSVTHRDVVWNGGLHKVPFLTPGMFLSLDFAGTVFSGTVTSLPDYNGYFMSPHADISFESGAFNADLFGRYGYETVAQTGEFHDGSFGLDLRYNRWGLLLEAGAAGLIDSADGLLAPFHLGAAWRNDSFFLRKVYVAGGLSTEKGSPYLLSLDEPFVALDGHSVYSSDWNVSLGFASEPLTFLSVSADAQFRRTAFDRGVLALLDSKDGATGLIPFVRENRDSLVTKGAAAWHYAGAEITARYTGEWLDRLYRKSLHSLEGGLSVFDAGKYRIWEAGITALVSLDSAEIPLLGAKGTVRPIDILSLSLSLDDALSLMTGKSRLRNGLYTVRSGALTLSARIDF